MSKLNITITHKVGTNEIVAKTFVSGVGVVSAKAKCSPEDEFDFVKGIEIATTRVKAKAFYKAAVRDFERADRIHDEIARLKSIQHNLYNNAEDCADTAMELRAKLSDNGHHE